MTRLGLVLLAAILCGMPDAGADGGDGAPVVSFGVDATRARVGRTRVISFGVDAASDVDRPIEWSCADGVVEVVRGPEVLAGETIGFLRVRGVREGAGTIVVGGEPLRVDVVRDADGTASWRTPRIVGPAEGASVWGVVAVGVEVFEGASGRRARLALDVGGRELEPVRESGPADGVWHRAVFEVDASAAPPGVLTLTPTAAWEDGAAGRGGSVSVAVVHPAEGELTAGEAEGVYDVERPRRFEDDRRSVGRDREASGGACFVNAGPIPAVCFPVEVASAGMYQMVVRASGSLAGGALPTVSVIVDGANQSVTNGRLVSEAWHRVAVGVPFRLEAGRHVVTPYFANDFYVPGRADRNLRLDTVEVLRVADAAGEVGPQASMMGGAMMGAGMMGGMAGAPSDLRSLGSAPTAPDPFGERAYPLRIGLERPLDGRSLSGALLVKGFCWWAGADDEDPRPPVVTLLVNGRAAATQRTGSPQFWVDATAWRRGENTIQLTARLDSGVSAATPVQTMTYEPGEVGGSRAARRHVRFSIHEDAWDDATRAALRRGRWPAERVSAVLYSSGELRLELPEDLEGDFGASLEMWGDQLEGGPIVEGALEVGGEREVVFEREVPAWWGPHEVEPTLHLPSGPKTLVLSFTNDAYEEGRGDRNLYVQSVSLLERRRGEDRASPVVEVRYPPDQRVMRMADAVVARVADDVGVEHVEVLIDDVPTGVDVGLAGQPGLVCLPLLLRDVEPGEHTVTLRARDAGGNEAWSEPRRIVVTRDASAPMTGYERAVRLLNRFAYGPDPAELAAVLTMGEGAWLRSRLEAGADVPGEVAALGLGLAHFWNRRDQYGVAGRAIFHAVLTPNPVRARFVLWCDNHFSTWIRKVEGDREWGEHVAFTRLGAASFQALLEASAHSPAMLRYLDQDTSFAGRINENYAREVMELHTLGVDNGYSQEDVTTLAHLLAGWTASEEGDGASGGDARDFTFRYDPALNDPRERRVVGMRFPEVEADEKYDRALMALETLAARPEAARFVCRELAAHYAGVPADEGLVDDLAVVFERTGGDMAEVLVAMASHPAFWAEGPGRMAQPLDFALRLSRTSGFVSPWAVSEYLSRSGAGLFDRATPDGYPEEDEAYADSNAMVQRWRLAQQAQWSLVAMVPGRWRWGPPEDSEEAWAQRVVDAVAVRLTGGVLSEASNEAAVGLLLGMEGDRGQRVLAGATFVAQLPEANLR